MKLIWRIVDRLFPCEFGEDCAYPFRTRCPHEKGFLRPPSSRKGKD